MFYGIYLPAHRSTVVPFETLAKRSGTGGQVGCITVSVFFHLLLIPPCCFGSSVPRDLLIKALSNVSIWPVLPNYWQERVMLAPRAHFLVLVSQCGSGSAGAGVCARSKLVRAGSVRREARSLAGACVPRRSPSPLTA